MTPFAARAEMRRSEYRAPDAPVMQTRYRSILPTVYIRYISRATPRRKSRGIISLIPYAAILMCFSVPPNATMCSAPIRKAQMERETIVAKPILGQKAKTLAKPAIAKR